MNPKTIRYEKLERLTGLALQAACTVYWHCFVESEWKEVWTLAEVLAEFELKAEMKADIHLAIDDETGFVVGFAMGHKLDLVPAEELPILLGAGIPAGSYWISDIGVLETYRKHKVAKNLLQRLITDAGDLQCPHVGTRTLVGCAAQHLFFNTGFQQQGVFHFKTGGKQSPRYVLLRDTRVA